MADPLDEIKQRIDKLENRFDDFSHNPLDSKLDFKPMQILQNSTERTNTSLLDSSHLDLLTNKLHDLEEKLLPKITLHSSMVSDWQLALENPSPKIYK